MKNFIDYLTGTVVCLWFILITSYLGFLIGDFVLTYFLKCPVYIQQFSVFFIFIGFVILMATLVNRIKAAEEYTKIIKEIDKNPNTPKAEQQVRDLFLSSTVREIV